MNKKTLLVSILILISILFVFINSNYFQNYWFKNIQNGKATILNYTVRLEDDWFPVLNTEKDYLVELLKIIKGIDIEYPSLGFDKFNCSYSNKCKIDIDFVPSDYFKKVDYDNYLSHLTRYKWGSASLIDEWKSDRDGIYYYMYYSNNLDVVITVTNKEYISQIKEISREKS